jgi:quercetin dioxygenase-like cupin family protein
MNNTVASHVAFGCLTALLASGGTYVALVGVPEAMQPLQAHAQAPPAAATGGRQTELFKTTMNDVLGRVATIRRIERDPGAAGGGPHRHPGSHTFGYVLEGLYEFQVDDGPLQRLGPGQTFYEPPGSLHAVSRNGSVSQPVKFLVFQVSDPTKPGTVPEPAR